MSDIENTGPDGPMPDTPPLFSYELNDGRILRACFCHHFAVSGGSKDPRALADSINSRWRGEFVTGIHDLDIPAAEANKITRQLFADGVLPSAEVTAKPRKILFQDGVILASFKMQTPYAAQFRQWAVRVLGVVIDGGGVAVDGANVSEAIGAQTRGRTADPLAADRVATSKLRATTRDIGMRIEALRAMTTRPERWRDDQIAILLGVDVPLSTLSPESRDAIAVKQLALESGENLDDHLPTVELGYSPTQIAAEAAKLATAEFGEPTTVSPQLVARSISSLGMRNDKEHCRCVPATDANGTERNVFRYFEAPKARIIDATMVKLRTAREKKARKRKRREDREKDTHTDGI